MTLTKPNRNTGFLRKEWKKEDIDRYIGKYRTAYFSYAADPHFREHAASGGVVTALFTFLLETKAIDGALVCRSEMIEGQLYPEFFIARNREELVSAQGSIYTAVEFTRDAVPLIKEFKGRLAVVSLPCDVHKLRRIMRRDPEIERKISLVVSLFCGHNSRPELTEMIMKKISKGSEIISKFRYRTGHWRGEMEAKMVSGNIIKKPFSYFSDYQNLFYFCQKKCHYCHDHTGYDADISIGDIWSLRMRQEPIKHSAVITRTEAGENTFLEALNSEWLKGTDVPIEEICNGQARSMPFHYNVSARAKAGKLVGIRIKDDVHARVRWNDFLVAWLVLANEKFSRTAFGKKVIEKTPRFILKILLFSMKGLESF